MHSSKPDSWIFYFLFCVLCSSRLFICNVCSLEEAFKREVLFYFFWRNALYHMNYITEDISKWNKWLWCSMLSATVGNRKGPLRGNTGERACCPVCHMVKRYCLSVIFYWVYKSRKDAGTGQRELRYFMSFVRHLSFLYDWGVCWSEI